MYDLETASYLIKAVSLFSFYYKKQPSGLDDGGDKAITFEPLRYIITYLSESCKPEDFQIPKYSVKQRQKQVLEQDYTY